jgi:hypothetical protein
MSTLKPGLLAAAAVIAVALPLHASSPKFFQAATQSDFLKGDVENLSIDSRGELSLGPATELIYESAAPFLWTLVAQPDGTLFVGSGNEGKVFKIDDKGQRIGFLRQQRAGNPRPRPGAEWRAVCRHLSGRQGLPRRSERPEPRVLRIRGQIHLGARRRYQGQPVRGDRRQGDRLQDQP